MLTLLLEFFFANYLNCIAFVIFSLQASGRQSEQQQLAHASR